MNNTEKNYVYVDGTKYEVVCDGLVGLNEKGQMIPCDDVAHKLIETRTGLRTRNVALAEDEYASLIIAIKAEIESIARDESKKELVKSLVCSLYKLVAKYATM